MPATPGPHPKDPGDARTLACTLGPSSLNERVLTELEAAGATLFRINMSHTEVESLGRILEFVRKHSRVPVSIDTEGARMRTGQMTERVSVFEGGQVRLVPEALWGDSYTIPIRPGEAIGQLVPETRVSIDFDAVTLRIDRVEGAVADATVLTGGEIGTRKAVTALPSPRLPTFTEKDRQSVTIALEHGVREFALSFCEDAAVIGEFRAMVGAGATVVAKVESRGGVMNIDEILGAADKVLIDRGDLSREVRMEEIPMLQKEIIHRANAGGVPVYVATNLLESMVMHRVPTRAEVNDVMNTLLDGADGLVLSAETAIGTFPVESTRMIASMMQEFARTRGGKVHELAKLLGRHPLESPRVPSIPAPSSRSATTAEI